MRLIDADKLIEEIRNLPNAGIHWWLSGEAVLTKILKAPSIKTERKTGKWIRKDKFLWTCSECQEDDAYAYISPKTNPNRLYNPMILQDYFCPHCGADMRNSDNTKKQEWIPFIKRKPTSEEREIYPDFDYIFDYSIPHNKEQILVSDGERVWVDTFRNESGKGCYLESEIDYNGCFWMPIPELYQEIK